MFFVICSTILFDFASGYLKPQNRNKKTAWKKNTNSYSWSTVLAKPWAQFI